MDLDRAIKQLTTAVRKELDDDQLRDVTEHGADSGFPGFTTYAETSEFYDKHSEAIWELLADLAEESGETVLDTLAGFNSADQVADEDGFKNLMTWFALEEIARRETDEDEDDEE